MPRDGSLGPVSQPSTQARAGAPLPGADTVFPSPGRWQAAAAAGSIGPRGAEDAQTQEHPHGSRSAERQLSGTDPAALARLLYLGRKLQSYLRKKNPGSGFFGQQGPCPHWVRERRPSLQTQGPRPQGLGAAAPLFKPGKIQTLLNERVPSYPSQSQNVLQGLGHDEPLPGTGHRHVQ